PDEGPEQRVSRVDARGVDLGLGAQVTLDLRYAVAELEVFQSAADPAQQNTALPLTTESIQVAEEFIDVAGGDLQPDVQRDQLQLTLRVHELPPDGEVLHDQERGRPAEDKRECGLGRVMHHELADSMGQGPLGDHE